MSATPRPGYVYILQNPNLNGWVKVGRTKRPPHKRAKELSTTAWPDDFEIFHARFFWDSVHAEKEIHAELENNLGSLKRKKEFFEIAPDGAFSYLMDLKDPIWKQTSILDEHWDPSLLGREMLEDRWQWAEEKLKIPAEHKQGWRELEELSAEGWADGSVRLAEKLMGKFDNPEHFRRASWVWQAAADQGTEGAEAWALWCRSWPEGQGLDVLLDTSWQRYGVRDPHQWPTLLMDLFEKEIFFWTLKPERAQAHPWWPALAMAWDNEAKEMGDQWNEERRNAWMRLRRQTVTSELVKPTPTDNLSSGLKPGLK